MFSRAALLCNVGLQRNLGCGLYSITSVHMLLSWAIRCPAALSVNAADTLISIFSWTGHRMRLCLSDQPTLPGPPQLCYVSLLFPAVKSLVSDALKKLPLEPSTADHLLSNMDHCVYSYTRIFGLGYFDSPFLATLTFLEVSVTALNDYWKVEMARKQDWNLCYAAHAYWRK